MSTLYKRKTSSYWWWSSKVRGKRERVSTGMCKKSLAEKVKDKWDMMVFNGDYSFLNNKQLPSSDIRTYMDEYLNVRSRISENTYNTARAVTARLVCFLNTVGIKSMSELNAKVLDHYIDSLDLAPKTIHNHFKELNTMLNRAIVDGLIQTNPIKHLTLPKIIKNDLHRMLEAVDLQIIFENPGNFKLFYEFLYYTGLRTGDVARLTYGNINFNRRSITSLIHKSSRFHELPLAEYLLCKIDKGKESEPLFPTLFADSKKKVDSNLAKPRAFMQSLLKAHDRPKATLHSFRTTFNNTLRDLGLGIDDRQKLMTHSSSETTKIYTHPNFALAKEWIDKIPSLSSPNT